MKVMVIVKATADSEAGKMPGAKMLKDMMAFNEELVRAGVLVAGEGLQPSSKGHRVKFSADRTVVTDGPFAETKELIAGYWIWQVKSMEEALDWAKRCPKPHEQDCEIELRSFFEVADFPEADAELCAREAALREQAAKR